MLITHAMSATYAPQKATRFSKTETLKNQRSASEQQSDGSYPNVTESPEEVDPERYRQFQKGVQQLEQEEAELQQVEALLKKAKNARKKMEQAQHIIYKADYEAEADRLVIKAEALLRLPQEKQTAEPKILANA
jgi:hypothetical protein